MTRQWPIKAGEGRLLVRASVTNSCVCEGVSLTNPVLTSSHAKYRRISMWREKKNSWIFLFVSGYFGSANDSATQTQSCETHPRNCPRSEGWHEYSGLLSVPASGIKRIQVERGAGLHLQDICVRTQQEGVPHSFPGVYRHSFSEVNNFLPCLTLN